MRARAITCSLALVALGGCQSKPVQQESERGVASSPSHIQCVSEYSASDNKKYFFGDVVSTNEIIFAIRDHVDEEVSDNYPGLKFRRDGISKDGKFIVFTAKEKSLAKGFASWGSPTHLSLEPKIQQGAGAFKGEFYWTTEYDGAPLDHVITLDCRIK